MATPTEVIVVDPTGTISSSDGWTVAGGLRETLDRANKIQANRGSRETFFVVEGAYGFQSDWMARELGAAQLRLGPPGSRGDANRFSVDNLQIFISRTEDDISVAKKILCAFQA